MLCVYALFDRKVREYGPLVLARNDGEVIRSLMDGIKGSNSLQEKHSKDFDLMCVGEFEQELGELSGNIRFVAGLADVLAGEISVDGQSDLFPAEVKSA